MNLQGRKKKKINEVSSDAYAHAEEVASRKWWQAKYDNDSITRDKRFNQRSAFHNATKRSIFKEYGIDKIKSTIEEVDKLVFKVTQTAPINFGYIVRDLNDEYGPEVAERILQASEKYLQLVLGANEKQCEVYKNMIKRYLNI